MRSALRLGVLVSFELGAVLALHSLGELPWLQVPRTDLAGWAAVTPAEDVIAAVARLAALAGAYWLLVSTICYSAAAAAHVPGAVRVAGWATLPAVRRIADRAVAVALVTSSVVGPSAVGAVPALGASPGFVAATPAPPVPLPPARSGEPPPRAPPPAATLPPGLPGVPPPDRGATGERVPDRGETGERARGDTGERARETGERGPDRDRPGRPAPDEDPTAKPSERRPVTHVVEPGDNLWSITTTALQDAGADHDTAAVHAAWVKVVAANRDRLRSGDPDLIHPGESITLTPLPVDGPPSGT